MSSRLVAHGFMAAVKAYPGSAVFVEPGLVEHWFQLVPIPDEDGRTVLEQRTIDPDTGGSKIKLHWEFLGVMG